MSRRNYRTSVFSGTLFLFISGQPPRYRDCLSSVSYLKRLREFPVSFPLNISFTRFDKWISIGDEHDTANASAATRLPFSCRGRCISSQRIGVFFFFSFSFARYMRILPLTAIFRCSERLRCRRPRPSRRRLGGQRECIIFRIDEAPRHALVFYIIPIFFFSLTLRWSTISVHRCR